MFQIQEKYKQEYSAYIDSLPEDKRKEELGKQSLRKKPKPKTPQVTIKTLKCPTINSFKNFQLENEFSKKVTIKLEINIQTAY